LGRTYEAVVCTEEAEVVVEPVELEDERVRGGLDVVVEEGPDDGMVAVGTSPTRDVSPAIIPPGPEFCAEVGVLCFAALDVGPSGLKGYEGW